MYSKQKKYHIIAGSFLIEQNANFDRQGKNLEEVLNSHPAKEWEEGFGDATMLVDRAYTGMTK
mgnify:CR=1 FL=1